MLENTDKLFAILISFLILGQGYIVRKIVGTWIFPACLFALFWFLLTFIPLVLIFDAPVEPLSIAFIFICTLAFSLGSLPFNWRSAFKQNSQRSLEDAKQFNSVFMHRLIYLSSILSIIFIVISSALNGISLNSMLFNFFESAAIYTEMRYADELDGNIFGRLSTILMYISPIVGGLIYYDIKNAKRKFFLLLVAAAPSLFIMITQSSKGALFLAMAFFYASILIRKIYANDLILFRPGFYRLLILYIALLLPILTVSFLSRGLYDVDDMEYVLHALFRYFASYTSAHIYAFSDWFLHYIGGDSQQIYSDHFYSYGNYTFMALFELFGSGATFPPGVYDEYYSYGDIITSNIYTVFRGLIYDFGGIGAVLFMLASGLILHSSFYKLLTSRYASIACALFICSIGYFYTSFIVSLLMWNSIYVTFILVCLLLFLNRVLGVERKADSILISVKL